MALQTSGGGERQERQGEPVAQVLEEDSAVSIGAELRQGGLEVPPEGVRILEENVAPVFNQEKKMGTKGGGMSGNPQGEQGFGSKRRKTGSEGVRVPDPELEKQGMG